VVPIVRTVSLSSNVEVPVLFLSCLGSWQTVEAYLIGHERFQAGGRPSGVVELQVAADGHSGLADRGVCVRVDLLELDGLLGALDEDDVAPAPLAVHADPDPSFS